MFGQGKWGRRIVFARAVHSWWQQRQLRAENAGRFLDDRERRSLLSAKYSGLVLDGAEARLSDDDSFRNLAVIATTGAGKTSSFILPNLLALDDRSIVATDPSGTLYERTSGDLVRRGYRVHRLDPTDLASSIGFNPLSRASTFPEMQEISHILIRTPNHGAKVDPFWIAGAEEIVSILIKCLKNHIDADRYGNLANVQYLLNSFGDGEALIPFVAANAPDDQTYHGFKGFIAQNEKTVQGMVSQAKSALSMLSDPDIARLTAASTFDFECLRREKTALFLVFPQNRVSYYALLANLFYTQLFHFCLDDRYYDRRSLPIYFLLDEFGHLTIPDFPAIITTTRARRISLSLVLQSVSQLEERYGKQGAHTILNGGVASRLFFSGMDIDTAQMLAHTIGETHRDHMDALGNVRTERELLMTPAALRAMPDNQVLYLFANKRPTLLNVTPYFERRDFTRRIETPPFRMPTRAIGAVEFVPL
ncbi:MAG: type IV secretory system conjugative DNA transfer family protein [Burkholderiales bacterium]